MTLLPDPHAMLAVADRIAAHARTVHARADRLSHAIDGAGWHGPAAGAFILAALPVAGGLRSCAQRLGDAADALRRHAAAVGRQLDLLEHLRATLLGFDIDVAELVARGVVTPLELLDHADALLDGLDGLAGTARHVVHGGVTVLEDAGALVGHVLGVGS